MRILLALAGLLALAACGAEGEPAGRPAADAPPARTALRCDDVPTCLVCTDPVSVTIDYLADAAGDPGTPVDVVRRRARELGVPLGSGDVVAPAGAAAGHTPTLVGVVRGETVVALFELRRASDGGWLVGTVTRCESP